MTFDVLKLVEGAGETRGGVHIFRNFSLNILHTLISAIYIVIFGSLQNQKIKRKSILNQIEQTANRVKLIPLTHVIHDRSLFRFDTGT